MAFIFGWMTCYSNHLFTSKMSAELVRENGDKIIEQEFMYVMNFIRDEENIKKALTIEMSNGESSRAHRHRDGYSI